MVMRLRHWKQKTRVAAPMQPMSWPPVAGAASDLGMAGRLMCQGCCCGSVVQVAIEERVKERQRQARRWLPGAPATAAAVPWWQQWQQRRHAQAAGAVPPALPQPRGQQGQQQQGSDAAGSSSGRREEWWQQPEIQWGRHGEKGEAWWQEWDQEGRVRPRLQVAGASTNATHAAAAAVPTRGGSPAEPAGTAGAARDRYVQAGLQA